MHDLKTVSPCPTKEQQRRFYKLKTLRIIYLSSTFICMLTSIALNICTYDKMPALIALGIESIAAIALMSYPMFKRNTKDS